MNDYERKRTERIERLRARAEAKRAEGDALIGRSHDRLARIPFGQPILVGHHSERRHRSDLSKADRDMGRGVEALNESTDLARRAHAAETNPSVSSDDPDAVAKLRAKAAKLQADCDRMKTINAMIRKGAKAAELAKFLGCTEESAATLLLPDFCGRVGFPPYKLTNDRAEIRRILQRIAQLEAHAVALKPEAIEHNGVRIEESDNRVRVFFPAKPDEATRAALKSRGFRWSPTVGAWQRHASNGAWYDARSIVFGVPS